MTEITDKKTYVVNDTIDVGSKYKLAFMFEDKKYQAGDQISLNDIQAANLIAAGFIKGATAA
ncbi:hypothetical protein [Vibrio quintilis]|uniref:Uncharacterized protein n=1 Tax=Vibrio quintilis TaxID=1117707 RepID=A0A1M7YYY9_9VIBR|nr:hypothetical protein [Vibrio quintilis]SHO57783.1 hypothetical protein VQ7734_03553 [Vibrio quintilis]